MLDNIDTVEVTGDLEVTVTTKVPWVAFPAFLYSSGRLGITAQAQLDDPDTCDRNLIGTGPFKMKSWDKGRAFVAEKPTPTTGRWPPTASPTRTSTRSPSTPSSRPSSGSTRWSPATST